MPFVIGKVTIGAGGVYHPPGTPVDVSPDDASALIPGYARLATDDEVAAHLGDALPPSPPSEPIAPAAPPEPIAPPASGDAPPPNRVADIVDALDLLDAADFEGDRPKLAALAAVLGFEPVQAEVDAALALKATL